MIVVTVAYPAASGTRFDLDYYRRTHMPLVHERWDGMGLSRFEVLRGTGAPGGGAAPFALLAILTFSSVEAFDAAVKQHGDEVMGDIPNFTDMQAQIQVDESVA